jgi:hypothetical protein
MKKLTNREKNIVSATIRLWNVNAEIDYVPDYELVDPSLSMDVMRDIRNLVQEVHAKSMSSKP